MSKIRWCWTWVSTGPPPLYVVMMPPTCLSPHQTPPLQDCISPTWSGRISMHISMNLPKHLFSLSNAPPPQTYFTRRTGAIDVDEAMVLDMGQYEMPHAAPADKKGHTAAGAPNLAGRSLLMSSLLESPDCLLEDGHA